MQSESDDILQLLQSARKLDRDKGVVQLKSTLKKKNDQLAEDLLNKFHETLKTSSDSSKWEDVHGGLLGMKCVVEGAVDGFVEKSLFHQDQLDFLHNFAILSLSHNEVRVRNEAGWLLGCLCSLQGSDVYKKLGQEVLKLLRSDLDRHIEGDSDNHNNSAIAAQSASNIFHESAGWRHLETTMKCLQHMIEGCGKKFNDFVNLELLDLLFLSLLHTNRFVRETGFNVCAAIVQCGQSDEQSLNNSIVKFGKQFSDHLARGLADNWSQVRLASSVASRNFLTSIDVDKRSEFFPQLIPRMCLNRYYIAEGVRIYSQDTWKIISEGHGKQLVEEHIAYVASYYIEATQADNHAVREAACACISELATKVNPDAVRPYVADLLNALLECFQDDSWPVRDAACIACGNFILSYSDAAKEKRDMLYSLFLGNLRDPIASVRQGAGLALAKYTKVYHEDCMTTIMSEIQTGLDEVKSQKDSGEKATGYDKKPAQFGVVKDLHTQVDLKHTDQQMYSCGSLAPKMGRGSRGGCSDCQFRRPSEPWERSDGCIYLITELSADFPEKASSLLPSVIACLSHKHYAQHLVLLETFCKQLPVMAPRLGKRGFKSHIESFIDPIFYALSCDVALTVAAAEDCLQKLAKFLGVNILKGRIENYNPTYVDRYCRVVAQSAFPGQAPHMDRPFKFGLA
uniref:Importin-4-like n=1 Tax=Phallusia mammillata TaxID=59560 RepID=A0A6F9DFS2_9ASCI|nr:importin-4-like [Phallusia mammillata]